MYSISMLFNFSKKIPEKKLRIAIVSDTYYPDMNGVAISLSKIVDILRKEHSVLFLRPDNQFITFQIEGNLKEIFFPFIRLPFYEEVKIGLPLFQRIQDALNAFKPDIVHIVTEGLLGLATLLIVKTMDLPIVADYRTNFSQYVGFYRLDFLKDFMELYLNYFHNECDLNLVPTREMKNYLLNKNYKNIKILGRGVDTELFHPDKKDIHFRKNLNFKEEDLICLYVGRIAPEKNLELLCEVFRSLNKKYKNIKLILLGDGPFKKELEEEFSEFQFLGNKTGNELSRIYASSDLFVFPSKTETFGNVFLEAFASGLPIVAYNYAASRTVYTHKKNSFLIPLTVFDEKKLWYYYLEKYLRNKALLQKHKLHILKNHHHKLKRLSWEGIARKLYYYYYLAIESRKLKVNTRRII